MGQYTRLIRFLRKPHLFQSCSSSALSKIVALRFERSQQSLLSPNISLQSSRTYSSQTRKSAADGNLLRIIRHETEYELQRRPLDLPVTEFNSFTVDDQLGQKWITLKRKFGANEEIKIEATMFVGTKSSAASEGDSDLPYRITLVVSIFKEGSDRKLEILCTAWPDCILIKKLGTQKCEPISTKFYRSPALEELDDELHDILYDYLEDRGINDELAVFLHKYMKNKEKREFVKWLEALEGFVEKK